MLILSSATVCALWLVSSIQAKRFAENIRHTISWFYVLLCFLQNQQLKEKDDKIADLTKQLQETGEEYEVNLLFYYLSMRLFEPLRIFLFFLVHCLIIFLNIVGRLMQLREVITMAFVCLDAAVESISYS